MSAFLENYHHHHNKNSITTVIYFKQVTRFSHLTQTLRSFGAKDQTTKSGPTRTSNHFTYPSPSIGSLSSEHRKTSAYDS
jgi:hypothetical protein